MEPLIALVAGTVLGRAAGPLLTERLRDGWMALRLGLATMFVVTGLAHFVGLREDLISMVPPALPRPGVLVTVTGVAELAGAGALLGERTNRAAAAGLAALLVAVYPANVHAATAGLLSVQPESLAMRTALQAVFLAALVAVWRSGRARSNGSRDRASRRGRATRRPGTPRRVPARA